MSGAEILETVISCVAALIVGGIAGRLSIRSKSDVRSTRLENDLKMHSLKDERDKSIILKSLLAIMLTLKDGKPNGELKEALGELNDYFISESAKQPMEGGNDGDA